MARHLLWGELGEDLAARHLEEKGMRIVGRRVRYRRGELDLVARDGEVWVFVEVKLRTGVQFGSPEQAFSPTKKRRFQRAVEEYITKHNLFTQHIRCDFIAVDAMADPPKIRHYPGGITF